MQKEYVTINPHCFHTKNKILKIDKKEAGLKRMKLGSQKTHSAKIGDVIKITEQLILARNHYCTSILFQLSILALSLNKFLHKNKGKMKIFDFYCR